MGKRRHSIEKQDALILSTGSDVEACRLEADTLYIAAPDSLEAWERDFNQQAKNQRTGEFLQVLSVNTKTPVKVYKNRAVMTGQTTDAIASKKQDEELAFMETRNAKNSQLLWVGIIIALLAVIIGIIVLLNLRDGSPGPGLVPMAILTLPWLKRNGKRGPIDNKAALAALREAEPGTILCMIIVESTGTYDFRQVDHAMVPEDSRERSFKGQPFHILGLDDSDLWAIEPVNSIKDNDSPLDLFLALQFEEEVNGTYGLGSGTGEKIKLGIFFVLIFFLVIILFLISVVAMGG